jgi:hypothetical protein
VYTLAMNKIHSSYLKHVPHRLLTDILTLVVGVALVGCAVGSSKPSPSSSPLTRASPLTAASSVATPRPANSPVATAPSASSAPLQLTVLHTNDTWGYLVPCG